MFSRFRNGVGAFAEGVRLLQKDRTLRALSMVPALMSLVLYTAGLVVGVMYVDDVLNWIIKTNISDYNFFLKSLIYIFSFLLIGFIFYFVTFIVVSILAIPICTTLSYKVLTQKTGYLVPVEKGFKENVFTFAKMLRVSVLKLGFLLIISAMLFVASLIPVISPVAVYLSVMIIAFDCMDYAMEHDEQGLRQRFRFLFQHIPEFSGFALCMAIILIIPFIHFILLPVAVLGSTVLYTRIQTVEKIKGKV